MILARHPHANIDEPDADLVGFATTSTHSDSKGEMRDLWRVSSGGFYALI
jgi:hypothetical protein